MNSEKKRSDLLFFPLPAFNKPEEDVHEPGNIFYGRGVIRQLTRDREWKSCFSLKEAEKLTGDLEAGKNQRTILLDVQIRDKEELRHLIPVVRPVLNKLDLFAPGPFYFIINGLFSSHSHVGPQYLVVPKNRECMDFPNWYLNTLPEGFRDPVAAAKAVQPDENAILPITGRWRGEWRPRLKHLSRLLFDWQLTPEDNPYVFYERMGRFLPALKDQRPQARLPFTPGPVLKYGTAEMDRWEATLLLEGMLAPEYDPERWGWWLRLPHPGFAWLAAKSLRTVEPYPHVQTYPEFCLHYDLLEYFKKRR